MTLEEQIAAWEAWNESEQGAFPCHLLRQFVASNWCTLTPSQKARVQALCQTNHCGCIYPTCG